MKFKDRLLQGTFIKRYKRFFVDINYKDKIITAHCPNTGSMMGLLNKGNKIWFSESDNPNRKLKFTLEMIEVEKKIVGLNIFQTSVFLLYISLGKVSGGTAPILTGKPETFSNPLPHVLILTAIVVGIATTALGLALVVRIRESYGTIEEDDILIAERSQEVSEPNGGAV